MKKLALLFALALAACASTPQTPQPDYAVTCVNKQDTSLNFTYEPSKAVQWYSTEYQVNVYQITTVEGKRITVNTLELENYTCQSAK